jgi:hypothetical protein
MRRELEKFTRTSGGGRRVQAWLPWLVVGVLLIGWIGLRVKPSPFPNYLAPNATLETVPLPANLPAPVTRFYRELYGERVPLVTSAVISGRARMKLFGLDFPARFRFVHEAGKAYRHYFEVTVFGLAIFKVNEHFVDGHAKLELPVGVQSGALIDQAANLALWAEAASFPALFVTDPRVRWSAIDGSSAVLSVPFGDELERFVVRFDPRTGLLESLEAMRYRDVGDISKHLWIARNRDWRTLDGVRLATTGTATWLDQGGPWATFTTEQIVLNADVRTYVRTDGL